MILHTLNASPSSVAFRECMKLIQRDDTLVLMGNGVYAALVGSQACTELLAKGVRIHLLRADAKAAGVSFPSVIEDIDMDGLVTLTEQFSRQLAWY